MIFSVKLLQRLLQVCRPASTESGKPTVLERVRADHLKCIEVQRGLRRQIQELSWVPESAPEVQRLRSERAEDGRRRYGKKALKAFRRPETGPERYALWDRKRAGKFDARYQQVLLGMLRGRSYTQIEPSREDNVYADYLHKLLVQYDPSTSITEGEIGEWVAGTRTRVGA